MLHRTFSYFVCMLECRYFIKIWFIYKILIKQGLWQDFSIFSHVNKKNNDVNLIVWIFLIIYGIIIVGPVSSSSGNYIFKVCFKKWNMNYSSTIIKFDLQRTCGSTRTNNEVTIKWVLLTSKPRQITSLDAKTEKSQQVLST